MRRFRCLVFDQQLRVCEVLTLSKPSVQLRLHYICMCCPPQPVGAFSMQRCKVMENISIGQTVFPVFFDVFLLSDRKKHDKMVRYYSLPNTVFAVVSYPEQGDAFESTADGQTV